jgi:hypothetical protein
MFLFSRRVACRLRTAFTSFPITFDSVTTGLPPAATRHASITTRLPAVATGLPAIATRLPAIATRLPAVATGFSAVCSGFPPALASVPAPGAPVSLLLLAGLPALVGQVEGLGNRQSGSLRLKK